MKKSKNNLTNWGKIKRHVNLFFREYIPDNFGSGKEKFSWENNKARNKDIILSRFRGEKYVSIAKRYNTSKQYIFVVEYNTLRKMIKWFNRITPNSL